MPVENPLVVDFIGVERGSGKVVLTISDHLDWAAEDAHLLTLQEKINRYLAVVESGEILTSYPDAADGDVVLDVVAKYPPTPGAESFLAKTRDLLTEAGFVSSIDRPAEVRRMVSKEDWISELKNVDRAWARHSRAQAVWRCFVTG